jgi:hypothetical protein
MITMKKKYFIGFCLIALVIGISMMVVLLQPSGVNQKITTSEPLTSQSPSTSGEVLGQLTSKIVLNTAVMKATDHVKVYKTLPKVVTKNDAIAFARKFNIIDYNEPKEGDAVISVSSKDMRYNVMLYKNGGSRYSDYHRIDNPNGVDLLANLPSDAEAEKIATTFLKERDLLPDGAVFGGSKHNKAYLDNQSGGEPIVDWEDILLGYTRELNGMKVEGTQFMVEVGAHGDIISFFANWKDYQPVGDYPIKSGESAFEELQQKGVSVGTGPNKPDMISVDQAYLAYHTNALAYHEGYLEPVWVFKGTAMAGGKSIAPVTEYIPALTEEAEKSLAP